MLPELKEIRTRRKRLDLTQAELARKAGVSQSLVAKLEKGMVDAAYSKVKHIFEVLDGLEAGHKATTAGALANTPVVGVQACDTVGRAMGLMKKHAYSQLPVFDGERVVGGISEGDLTDYLAGGKDPSSLPGLKVRDVMGEAFPQVGEEAPSGAVVDMLQHFPAVLVVKRGRVTGIVTRADLFKVVRGA